MARFGLLTLNEGNWEGNQLINSAYFTEMTTPSQDINEAYGYLWWLNGQDSYRLPGTTTTFTGKLIPTAPDDLIASLGKDDQKVYVLPSEGLVVIRLGDATEESLLGPSGFDTDLWEKIMAVIQ
jgi:CubicO group peptidase (beta-lactamase class C family)